ncbi:hypothetical protein QYF61_004446 [Mycteria americana]|uniref:Ig-like domain-containing protein n=1 Tax=Mycteria americana TaxID=33587 RepID=A0AAN7MX11_MYCAM|nr:hypothetical protein QYF61_004446 [Mycteria americana]
MGEAGRKVATGRGLHSASLPSPALPGVLRAPGEGEPATLTCRPAQTGVFQEIAKAKCEYLNGTDKVRLVHMYIYNRQQLVHFDSDVGHFVADSPLGEPDAKYWNSQPDLLEQKQAAVDTFCRHNYRVLTPFIVERRGECVAEHFPGTQARAKPQSSQEGRACPCRWAGPRAAPSKTPAPFHESLAPSLGTSCVGTTGTALGQAGWPLCCPSPFPALSHSPPVQPKVRVSPMQSSSLPQTDRLVCAVTGFYPAEIEVKWFKNGQEETERVVSTDVIQNGDWTYQVLVMLETTPQRGDTYTCQVEHVSLQHPVSQHWALQSDAGRSKMLTGVGGFVLGLIFLALGLFLYMRKKGAPFPRLQGS